MRFDEGRRRGKSLRDDPNRTFLYTLAAKLGRTVNELLHSISYRELLGWIEFYGIEPFDEQRGDIRNAMLMSLLANINRNPKKTKAFRVKQFLPFPRKARSSPKRSPKKDRLAAAKHEADKRLAAPGKKVVEVPSGEEVPLGRTHVSAETLTYLFLLSGKAPN